MNPNPASTKNTLAADVEIKGSIKFQNRGEIKTKSVTVFGKVHGNITVEERCELKSRAVLQGDLKASRLVIEEGATFVGKSEVTPNRVAMKQPEIVRAPEQRASGTSA
mgnify:CR=1 FL=1